MIGQKSVSHKIGCASFKSGLFILFLICVPFMNCTSNGTSKSQLWSVRMAESVMTRRPNGYGDWDYVTGTVLKGFEELWRKTSDKRYFQYIQKTVDSVVNSDGSINDYKLSDYNIDEINEGRMLLFLYKETGEEKYKKAAALLRSQLMDQPRNSLGGFWHKKKYPFQMWLDGLYMGSPFYAEYGKLFDEPENFDDVVKQFTLMETHARDAETWLLYHAWDEKKEQDWADPATGLSAIFWGRAMGWYAMALVDVLDYLPVEHSGRNDLIAILQRLAEAVSKVQDDSTGVWWQVVDQSYREGNYLEASVSGMFVYALAKGVRLGYLDAKFKAVAEKAYQGILKEFISENEDGTIDLNQICRSAGLGYGRDGSYEYYVYQEKKVSNDGKGVGPFITASLEMEMMEKH
jgi:unsaturated rhamnogalacturonyl hydrolase